MRAALRPVLRGIAPFLAHVLRALALQQSWVLPENRERWWRMPSALPPSPGQIRHSVWKEEGGREMRKTGGGGEEGKGEDLDRDHVPVPSVPLQPLLPARHKTQRTMGLGMFNPDLQN